MDVADITEEEEDEEVGHRGGDCIVKSENELRTAEEMMNGKERQIRRNCGRGGRGRRGTLGGQLLDMAGTERNSMEGLVMPIRPSGRKEKEKNNMYT